MSEPTMIERLAGLMVQAIADNGPSADWNLVGVRAILTELRTPSEAMLRAGLVIKGDWEEMRTPQNYWQAMIDAILNEGK